ncbi:MAG: hypothetical protein AB1424_06970 [Thermodesulfobacteriota bacterium]
MGFKSINFRWILLLVILPVVAATVLAELTGAIIERQQRKSVRDYGYVTKIEGMEPGGLLRKKVDAYVSDGLGGRVRWLTNSRGFRNDREFNPHPPPGVLRILSLGDSFNSGYRVGQKETVSSLLEEWINHHYGKCEVLVAQTEEPATALYYLDRFGVRFHPDLVLLGITLGNDIAQTYLSLDPYRGYNLTVTPGDARIEQHKGTQKTFRFLREYKIPSDYLQSQTPLAQMVSEMGHWLRKRHLVRRLYQEDEPITSWGDRNPPLLFDPINGLGMYTAPPPPEIAEAFHRLDRTLGAFKTYCDRRGIILAVQLFPQRYQVSPRDWERAVAEYRLKASRFDLLGPNKKIRDFCGEHGIFLIDPTPAMAAYCARTGTNLYLPRGDMHWNREGHRVFFESARESYGILAAKGFTAVWARDNLTQRRQGAKLNF